MLTKRIPGLYHSKRRRTAPTALLVYCAGTRIAVRHDVSNY